MRFQSLIFLVALCIVLVLLWRSTIIEPINSKDDSAVVAAMGASVAERTPEPDGLSTLGPTKVYTRIISDASLADDIAALALEQEKNMPGMKRNRGTNHGGKSYHGTKTFQDSKDESAIRLHQEVERFVRDIFLKETDRTAVRARVQQSWINIQREDGFNAWHGHRSGAQMSVVFYGKAE